MRDLNPDTYCSRFPRCPLSSQCVSLLDEIEILELPGVGEQYSTLDSGDRQQIEQLVLHVRSCRVCGAAITHARTVRKWQRDALHDFLSNSEREVPPTTEQIIAAIHQEPPPLSPLPERDTEEYQDIALAPFVDWPDQKQSRPSRIRTPLLYLSTLSVAAVLIFATMGAFQREYNYQVNSARTAATVTPKATMAVTTVDGANSTMGTALVSSHQWSSVLAAYLSTDGRRKTIDNYDLASGRHLPLSLPFCCSGVTEIDAVSHDGSDLIYHQFDPQARQTTYYTRSGMHYLVPGRGGNAVWATNDQYLFAADDQGSIWKIAVQSGQAQRISTSTRVARLAFARDNYLYFQSKTALYRIDVASNNQSPQTIFDDAAATIFGLDPNDLTVYYTKVEHGKRNIYAARGRFSTSQVIFEDGTLVGYDASADYALMIVRQDPFSKKFQLIKYNDRTGTQEIVLSDVASGALSLCDADPSPDHIPICENNIACSPTARRLVTEAGYRDGSHKVLSIDWQNNARTEIAIPTSNQKVNTHLQLLGWDTLLVK